MKAPHGYDDSNPECEGLAWTGPVGYFLAVLGGAVVLGSVVAFVACQFFHA